MKKVWLRIIVTCVVCAGLAMGVLTLIGGYSTKSPGAPIVPAVTIFAPATMAIPSPIAQASAVATAVPVAVPSTTAIAVRVMDATAPPTATPSSAPPSATVSATARVLPASAKLSGLRYERQGFNNCGPATVSMLINALGVRTDQNAAMAVLRPVNGVNGDRNVGPREMVAFAESQGLRARLIQGASVDQLRALLVAGMPAIVETWFIPEPNDEMGHYGMLMGYDAETMYFYDSYRGPSASWKLAEFEQLWRVFNRTVIVAWRPEQEAAVRAIFGELMEDRAMYARALATARADAQRNPQDAWAYFNAGTNLLRLGDSAGAAQAYDAARKIGLPWRTLWYQFGPYNAYYDVGRYDDVISLANETLRTINNLEESYYWRAQAYAAKGLTDATQRDMAMVKQLKPNFDAKLQAGP